MIPTVTPDLRLLADDLTGALDTAAELTALCGPVRVLWDSAATVTPQPGSVALASGTREARAGLSLASLYGGFCLGPLNTTAGHTAAYPLGTRHHTAHGHACALVFAHTLAFNTSAVPERTALTLQALGLGTEAGDRSALKAAHGFCTGLGIEMRLSRLGVPEADLPAMAEEAHAIRRLLDNNPRDISREQILAIYRAAY